MPVDELSSSTIGYALRRVPGKATGEMIRRQETDSREHAWMWHIRRNHHGISIKKQSAWRPNAKEIVLIEEESSLLRGSCEALPKQ